jgi:hypothetical protein
MLGYERYLTVVLICAGLIILATVVAVLHRMPIPFPHG